MGTTASEHAEQLIRVGREAAAQGLAVGSGGNLSVRVSPTEFLTTATGSWLNRLTADDLVLTGVDGVPVDGTGTPSSEWRLHARTYLQRPDVNAVVHLHPQFTVMLDAAHVPIRLVAMDHRIYVGRINRVGFFYSGSDLLAEEAAHVSVNSDVVILAYHGCSCLGGDIDMAFRRALYLEQAARMTYLLTMMGDKTTTFPTEFLEGLSHA